eukprot:SAG11_NODE_21270_length_428_cov_1.249240_1_plen_68_part_01
MDPVVYEFTNPVFLYSYFQPIRIYESCSYVFMILVLPLYLVVQVPRYLYVSTCTCLPVRIYLYVSTVR